MDRYMWPAEHCDLRPIARCQGEEAQTHATGIVAIVKAPRVLAQFKRQLGGTVWSGPSIRELG